MKQILKIIMAILGLAVVFYFVYQVRLLIVYLIISMIMALMGTPLMKFFDKIKIKKKSFPRSLSAILTLSVFVVFFGCIAGLIGPLITQQIKVISSLDIQKTGLNELITSAENSTDQLHLSSEENVSNREYLEDRIEEIVNLSLLTNTLNKLMGMLGDIFIAAFSIFFISFFFLKEKNMLERTLSFVVPDKHMEKIRAIRKNITRLLSRYFLGLLVQITLITLLISISLSIFGVKYAILIGFIAGLMNLIPYFGPILGMLIGLIISMASGLETQSIFELWPLALKVISVFLGIQLLDNIIFQPFIFSNSVNAHPLEIFLVISIMGTLAGIPGLIIAIPLYTFLKVIAKEFLSKYAFVQKLTKNI